MGSGRVLFIPILTAVLGGVTFAQPNLLDGDPDSPTFNNPSFERPDTEFVSVAVDRWTLSGPTQLVDIPGVGTVPILAGCGIFENPAPGGPGRIEGADGTQLAYLFANSVNDVLTGQPMDHAFTQILETTFEAGKQYQLAVGIAYAQAQPPPDSVFTLSLFAHDPSNPTIELPLASQPVTNTGAINGTSLTDFFATTGEISGEAVGKQIGIRFSTHTSPQPASATGQFDFDNVRLTIVPEPASAALWAAAGFVAVLSRRRGARLKG